MKNSVQRFGKYGLAFENKPKRIVVTDINDAKIARAKEVISEAEAAEKGV